MEPGLSDQDDHELAVVARVDISAAMEPGLSDQDDFGSGSTTCDGAGAAMEPGLSDQDDLERSSAHYGLGSKPQWSLVFPTRMTRVPAISATSFLVCRNGAWSFRPG